MIQPFNEIILSHVNLVNHVILLINILNFSLPKTPSRIVWQLVLSSSLNSDVVEFQHTDWLKEKRTNFPLFDGADLTSYHLEKPRNRNAVN